MRNKLKMALIVPLLVILVSCADLAGLQNPKGLAGAGVAGALATKTVEKVQDVAEFIPELKLTNLSICVKSIEKENQFRCIKLNCVGADCVNYVSQDKAVEDINNRKAVVMNTKEWSEFITIIKHYCSYDKIKCNLIGEEHSSLERAYIVGV